MKISSLYYTHKPGGFCKRLYRLLNALSGNGHQVTYYSLDKPPDILDPKIKWRKIPFCLQARSGVIFWILFSLWAPAYLLFTEPARWVIFSPYYCCLLGPHKILHGSSLICFIRSKMSANYQYMLANLLDNLMARCCFEFADKLIFQTHANKNLAISNRCDPAKTELLPNNISNLSFQPITFSQPLRFVTAGVFNQKKNLSVLTDCWHKLKADDFTSGLIPFLHIIGSGKPKADKPESANIIIEGWQNDLSEIFSKSHIYIHPSLHEGMPNAVLEAMGMGLAVLLADTPELRELAADGDLLFPASAPARLAEIIRSVANNQSHFEKILAISRKRAELLCFDWDKEAVQISLN